MIVQLAWNHLYYQHGLAPPPLPAIRNERDAHAVLEDLTRLHETAHVSDERKPPGT